MNMMRGNRLRACGKAIRRVAALVISPFLKAPKVENKYIVVDGREEEVIPFSDFVNTESRVSRWISESARYVAEVSPMDPTLTSAFQKHIGKLCRDYTIFEVAYHQTQRNELGDTICENSSKSRPSESAPSENTQDNEECLEDYSILQIAY
ncbi:hypothetical protein ScPMuIL_014665 [Solemya velum]